MTDFTVQEVKDFSQELKNKLPWVRRLMRFGLGIAVLITVGLASLVLGGIVLGLSQGLYQTAGGLDPVMTLTLVSFAYFTAKLQQLDPTPSYRMVCLGALLSFFAGLIPGLVFLMLIIPALRKVKIV